MNGIHEFKEYIFCNKCNKNKHKHKETLIIYKEVYCLDCWNWLCGEYDAFGIEETE